MYSHSYLIFCTHINIKTVKIKVLISEINQIKMSTNGQDDTHFTPNNPTLYPLTLSQTVKCYLHTLWEN